MNKVNKTKPSEATINQLAQNMTKLTTTVGKLTTTVSQLAKEVSGDLLQ